MGQRQTSLDIDPLFQRPADSTSLPGLLVINVNQSISLFFYYNKQGTFSVAAERLEPTMQVENSVTETDASSENQPLQITLASHLREFEIITPQWETGEKMPSPSEGDCIERHEAIGVIIDFSRALYIKLWRNAESPKDKGFTLQAKHWSPCDEKSKERGWLSNDLALGYDVAVIDYTGKVSHYCEECDDRDNITTKSFDERIEKQLARLCLDGKSDDDKEQDTRNQPVRFEPDRKKARVEKHVKKDEK